VGDEVVTRLALLAAVGPGAELIGSRQQIQVEAVLLRQILSETRKTVIASSETPESNVTSIYNDMVNNQLADKISRSGEFGLAKSLQAQLVHQVLPEADAARAKAGLTPTQPINTPKRKP